MLNYASLQSNCSYAGHSHPHEQAGIYLAFEHGWGFGWFE